MAMHMRWKFGGVVLLVWAGSAAARAGRFAAEVALLARVKQRMRRVLSQVPNYTCLEAAGRAGRASLRRSRPILVRKRRADGQRRLCLVCPQRFPARHHHHAVSRGRGHAGPSAGALRVPRSAGREQVPASGQWRLGHGRHGRFVLGGHRLSGTGSYRSPGRRSARRAGHRTDRGDRRLRPDALWRFHCAAAASRGIAPGPVIGRGAPE